MISLSTSIQRIAVALAVVLAMAPLLSGFEHSGHSHRFCEEHQAVEEMEQPEAARMTSGVDAPADQPQIDRGTALVGDSDSHRTCTLLSANFDTSGAQRIDVTLEIVFKQHVQLTLEQHGAGAPIPLLASSPKASPPRS